MFAWLTALMVVEALIAWGYVQVRYAPGYGTDELAFDQYAGGLAQHGLDPYLHSMAPSFSLFHVSPDGYTYSLTGVGYPALVSGTGVSGVCAVSGIGLVSSTCSGAERGRVGSDYSADVRVAPASRAPSSSRDRERGRLCVERGRRSYGRPLHATFGPCGLPLGPVWARPLVLCRSGDARPCDGDQANSVVAAAVYSLRSCARRARAQRDAEALKRCGRYLVVVTLAFLLPNAPYIVASPGKWIHGVATPIVSHLVPAGQGAVALSLFLGIGGGSLAAYTIASVALALLLLALYAGTYPLLRAATFILPAVVLFFASRSYGSYLVSLVPAALVGAVSVKAPSSPAVPVSTSRRMLRGRSWGPLILMAALVFAVAVVHALTAAQPLRLRVTGIRTTGQLATIEQLNLHVTNASGGVVRPSFTIGEGGEVTTFWHVIRGPLTLPAGRSADYTVVAPNFPAQPSIAGGFVVLAFSQGPAAVSSTGPYEPSTMHVGLTPNAVNKLVSVGRPVVVRAELLDQLDRPVHKANVPIFLGQIVYDQSGLELGEAAINSRPPGQTPVSA